MRIESMPMKLLITMEFTEEQIEAIRAVSEDIEPVYAPERSRQLAEIEDAEIVLGQFDRELFDRSRDLRWVQTWSAGADALLFPEFVASDVLLTTSKGHVGTHLADHAIALMLALMRGLHTAIRTRTWEHRMPIRQASWEPLRLTMGILGLGGTGTEVARRATAFGMRNLAVDPELPPCPAFVEALWPTSRFPDLLAESDVLAVCAPLTSQTNGLFGRDAFRRMKPTALLINVTRGKIVDTSVLLDALRAGQIAGAGLDVTDPEPLPPDHPLWTVENAIVTPHCSGGSPLRTDRVIRLFCDNLGRFLRGESLRSAIDKEKGY